MSTISREHEPRADEHATPADLPTVRTWAVIVAGVVVIAAFVGLFVIGWIPRERRLAMLNHESQELHDFLPQVRVAQPTRAAGAVNVLLPADTSAWQQTAIFPQANGYLVKQLVDIGDSVKAGQLLAVISMPEVDAQILQAKADVTQAEANLKRMQDNNALAQATLKRYQDFFKTGGITRQQLDQYHTAATQAQADLSGADASLQASKANLQRLAALQSYENVTAPFAGTITARNYDLGALMSASNTAPGKELFDLANTSVLRVFVDVDQSYVTSAKVGDPAAIEVRNYPGRQFPGAIARTAGALNPATRKMRYEIDVPNKNNLLYPGMYAEAILKINQQRPSILVPTSALIFDAAGTRLWIVRGNTAHDRKVTVGRDFGTQIEITSGLEGDEQIVTNPGGQLTDGMKVDVARQSTTQSS
jgi:RND family efflux transporter MFP subunit